MFKVARQILVWSVGPLALVLPEMFKNVFDGLRASPYFAWYQGVCAVWTLCVVVAFVPWQRTVKLWRGERVRIAIDLADGTARMGEFGLLQARTADLVVKNEGDPVTLIAHARLTNASLGLKWSPQEDKWDYEPRPLASGPDISSGFHLATVEPDDVSLRQWVVIVRAEHMGHVQRWTIGQKGELWFDVQFDFYSEVESVRSLIQSVGLHVSLSDDRTGFVMNLKP